MLRNIHFCRANAAQRGRSLILTDGNILYQQSNGNVNEHIIGYIIYNSFYKSFDQNLLLATRAWCVTDPGVFAPEIRQFYTDITNIALTPRPRRRQAPGYWLLVVPTLDWIKNIFPNCFRLIYCYFSCSFISKRCWSPSEIKTAF